MDLGDLVDLEVPVDFVALAALEGLGVHQQNHVWEANLEDLWVQEVLAAQEASVDLVVLVDQMDQPLLEVLVNLVVKADLVGRKDLVDLGDLGDLEGQMDHCHRVVQVVQEGPVDLVAQEGLRDQHHQVALVNLVDLAGLAGLGVLVVQEDLVDQEDLEMLVSLVDLVYQAEKVREDYVFNQYGCSFEILLIAVKRSNASFVPEKSLSRFPVQPNRICECLFMNI